MIKIFSTLLVFSLAISCHISAQTSDQANVEELVQEVEDQMGGREAYNATHYLKWTFFGKRTLLWDKWSGNVRIEFAESDNVFIVNINDNTGKIWLDGVAQTNTDTIAKYTQQAKSIWINDSYWLVMPWKLQDPGVNLSYLHIDEENQQHVLQLTFDGVGNTPENKYYVKIGKASKLVEEWQFFTRFDDAEPRFSTPWANYQTYGNIQLSDDRGRAKLTNIEVLDAISSKAFDALTY